MIPMRNNNSKRYIDVQNFKLQLSYLLKTMLQEGSPFDSSEIDSLGILNLSSLAA